LLENLVNTVGRYANMHGLSSLFGYIGPETIVPATSALAAVGGIILAFGKSILRPFVAGFFWIIGKRQTPAPAEVATTDTPVLESEVTQS
jgi:hypothetical protein